MDSLFGKYWDEFSNKSLKERREYFTSLSYHNQQELIKSFFEEKWDKLIVRNFVDQMVDYIKTTYDIDLINMRLQAITHGRIFLIDKKIWEHIEDLTWVFADYYDVDMLFGGMMVETWGKEKQFYRIRAIKNQWR